MGRVRNFLELAIWAYARRMQLTQLRGDHQHERGRVKC